jgi:hypothetical protein
MRADDPIYLSRAVTIERVPTVDNRSGRQITKEIKVPLVLPKDNRVDTSVPVQEDTTANADFAGGLYEDLYDDEPIRPTGTRKV